MNKVRIYCDWDLLSDFESEIAVELFVDNRWRISRGKTHKVLYVCEPESIFPHMVDVAINNQGSFHHILTHNEKILAHCKNAILFEFGGTWIPDTYEFKEKHFSISTVVGQKTATSGHKMRHVLWERQAEIKNPKCFYQSRHGGPTTFLDNPILVSTKDVMFDSQFHVSIENSSLKYYFTEKLLDCFRTKTIPIYWGCPNIGDYFNLDGMIVAKNVDEIIAACNYINPATYASMRSAIEDNYRRSDKYKNLSKRLDEKLGEIIYLPGNLPSLSNPWQSTSRIFDAVKEIGCFKWIIQQLRRLKRRIFALVGR